MEDNARIELERVKKANKKITKTKLKLDPFYSTEDVAHTHALFDVIDYQKEKEIDDIEIKLYRSGHILGAASILVKARNKNYLFSGDLGKNEDILHLKRDSIDENIDEIIMESTYGDRVHSIKDVKDQLEKLLRDAIKNKTKLLIPAFSFGRSQIILSLLAEIFNKDKSFKMPIFLDSPMSAEILKIYEENTDELNIDREMFHSIQNYTQILELSNEKESILQK